MNESRLMYCKYWPHLGSDTCGAADRASVKNRDLKILFIIFACGEQLSKIKLFEKFILQLTDITLPNAKQNSVKGHLVILTRLFTQQKISFVLALYWFRH